VVLWTLSLALGALHVSGRPLRAGHRYLLGAVELVGRSVRVGGSDPGRGGRGPGPLDAAQGAPNVTQRAIGPP